MVVIVIVLWLSPLFPVNYDMLSSFVVPLLLLAVVSLCCVVVVIFVVACVVVVVIVGYNYSNDGIHGYYTCCVHMCS